MKIKLIIIIGAIVLCICCKNNVKPTIQKEFLKSDWIIPDSSICFIEDSLMLLDIYPYDNNIRVNKYSISNDSLILQPDIIPYQGVDFKVIFKILELTKNRFKIQFISNSTNFFRLSKNRKLFFTRDTILRNNKIIKNFEFSSRRGLWDRTPMLDMRVGEDSILYLLNFRGNKRYKGVVEHKLTRIEFERINRKINRIELDSLNSDVGAPDAPYFSFLLKTKDSLTYEYSSCLCRGDIQKDLPDIFEYFYSLEWLLKFDKSKLDTLIHSRRME